MDTSLQRRFYVASLLIGIILCVIGLWLTGGGAWLLWLGGSSYYLLAGATCLAAGYFHVRHRLATGRLIYALLLIGTAIWAFAEVGTDVWQLIPRIAGPLTLGAIIFLHALWTSHLRRLIPISATVAILASLIGAFMAMSQLPPLAGGVGTVPAGRPENGDDWYAFGRTWEGTRYSPAAQITPANVGLLKPAWTARIGDFNPSGKQLPGVYMFQATPIKIDDMLYICSANSAVVALDAETGAIRWRFAPTIHRAKPGGRQCRGVSHYAIPGATGPCASRIISPTIDARLMAVDARTGKRCAEFGKNGEISLTDQLYRPGSESLFTMTSPPVILNGVVIVGGSVQDGISTGEPSGVIRGYDAVTGALRWAWDPGAREENRIPPPGETFTLGSPNSWSVMSADPALGLVYIPMGNATPDYVNQHRTPEDGRYSSAVVALDAATGTRRWHFQTVHADIWDYDIGSQPVLFDMPISGGGSVPALAQPTKGGDIFILDRRTGKPLTPVEERAVPRGDVPGERYSPTQPVSTGFPSLSPARLREKDMWGATPLDQLWCRIRYRSLDYKGKFTPPSLKGTLQYPGSLGVVDWGSVAIDPSRGLMIVNSSHLPMTSTLYQRDVADQMAKRGQVPGAYFGPQKGTPYGINAKQFLSPIGLPCNAPPWGLLTAINLADRTIKWQRTLGSSRDHAPFGIAIPGVFNLGGAVVTRGGVTFVAATIDNYLRAFDTVSGKELWRGRLPAGGQAGAMTFTSGKDGRQYVVIAAGGHQLMDTKLGDYVVAFALPQ